MKLYLVSRTDKINYNEFDSFVVAAESEERALEWHPDGKDDCDGWTNSLKNLKIECIGESNSPVEKVIIASFNAG